MTHPLLFTGRVLALGGMSDVVDIFAARQPIHDRANQVVAYEVLYRAGAGPAAAGAVDEKASFRALSNFLVEIGLDRLVGDRLAFINVPEPLLGSEELRLLPQDRVVLEILETVAPTPENLVQVRALKEAGYRLAMDDYVFESVHDPFLEWVEMVKVDVVVASEAALRAGVPRLQARGLKLLAEKVETPAVHELCRGLGFDFFQGYYYAKPALVHQKAVRGAHATSVRILAELQNPAASVEDVHRILSSDAVLSYKVMRLVNSASSGLRRRVDSLEQAIIYLGNDRIRALASLTIMASVTGKPQELLRVGMIRARMAEEMARVTGLENPSRFFTVGLFSVLDALMDLPMGELLPQMPLLPEVAEALSGAAPAASDLARILHVVTAYERGDWAAVEFWVPGCPASWLYQEAVSWAAEAAGSG